MTETKEQTAPELTLDPDTGEVQAIELQVDLQSVSVNKGTASVGFKFQGVAIEDAVGMFVSKRLEVELSAGDPDQVELFKGDPQSLKSVADVNKLSVGPEDFLGKLSFSREDVDMTLLTRLAAKRVTLKAKRVGQVEDEGGEE